MQKHWVKMKDGFTLIELLFVIAVIGVMASLGMSYMKQHQANTKIQRAAVEMQQMLQAGMAYYVDNSQWPSKDCDKDPQCKYPHFDKYLPVGGKVDPWGSFYSWCIADSTGKCADASSAVYDPYEPGDSKSGEKMFEVTDNSPNNATAKSIGALLPNSNYSNNIVSSEVTIPGQVSSNNDGSGVELVSVGIWSRGDSPLIEFQCPIGKHFGEVYAAPTHIQTEIEDGDHGAFPIHHLFTDAIGDTADVTATCTQNKDNPAVYDCTSTIKETIDRNPNGTDYENGSTKALYMAVCKKNADKNS